MAKRKRQNTSLHCILRHCGVSIVRRIPQDSESRKLAYLCALSFVFFA